MTMTYHVFYTKDFNACLRSIQAGGAKAGRDIVRKIRAAMTEAATTGEIADLHRTRHGEDRLPNVEKYELGAGANRLVVQVIDQATRARAFLYAGNHDDTQRWLDNHQDYRWVESTKDRTLQFVQVVTPVAHLAAPSDRLDLTSPPLLLSLPLLRVVTDGEWEGLSLADDIKGYLKAVTGEDYERDADGILAHIAEVAGYDVAALAIDLLHHAHIKEFDQLAQRIRLATGDAVQPTPAEIVNAMNEPANAEVVITFDDDISLAELMERSSLSDWMLFLHAEQRRVAFRDFAGPVRLRGVSGSGKTSVLVHRARFLARKFGLPVAVVTLTESMRKLLEVLIRDLCGAEQHLIDTLTMSQLAKEVIQHEHPKGLRHFLLARPAQIDAALARADDAVRRADGFADSSFNRWDRAAFRDFLRDEIQYVRSRLLVSDYERYLDGKQFKRIGRGTALSESARGLVLAGVHAWDAALAEGSVLDNEGIAADACALLANPDHQFRRYRAVVADEVQDLSQIDVTLLARLIAPHGSVLAELDNGLFLVGDGAQTIYRRGFRLRSAGIEVATRSFLLRKNYRNTFEILRAAFALIERYAFADGDEDDFAAPTAPDYAKRRGERPQLVKCSSPDDEALFIATQIHARIGEGTSPGQIGVIGAGPSAREKVQAALERKAIKWVELREDVQFEGERVKISTIESAKGHEFEAVFVAGLLEGTIPHAGSEDNELPREAARLYVAMTRARESLWLSFAPSQRLAPSRFLVALQPFCDEFRFDHGELRAIEIPEEVRD